MTSFLVSPTDPNPLETMKAFLAGKARKLRVEKSVNKEAWPRIEKAAFSLVTLNKYTVEIKPDSIVVSSGAKKKATKKKPAKAGAAPKKRISKPKTKKSKK